MWEKESVVISATETSREPRGHFVRINLRGNVPCGCGKLLREFLALSRKHAVGQIEIDCFFPVAKTRIEVLLKGFLVI